jgi:hypothetical protein
MLCTASCPQQQVDHTRSAITQLLTSYAGRSGHPRPADVVLEVVTRQIASRCPTTPLLCAG